METKQITLDATKIDQRYVYRILKRIFDFCASLLALIPLSIIFLVIALLIKLDDGGPVFFSQTRVGRHGKPFKIYKFRSMRVDAEDLLEKLMEKIKSMVRCSRWKTTPASAGPASSCASTA